MVSIAKSYQHKLFLDCILDNLGVYIAFENKEILIFLCFRTQYRYIIKIHFGATNENCYDDLFIADIIKFCL
jgi:hypothetical protein